MCREAREGNDHSPLCLFPLAVGDVWALGDIIVMGLDLLPFGL